MTAQNDTTLELGDIQAAALMPRPYPYAGSYVAVRIDDRRAGRELLRRLLPLLERVGRPEIKNFILQLEEVTSS